MHGPMNVKDVNELIVRINDDSRVHSHIFRQQLYFLIVSGLGLTIDLFLQFTVSMAIDNQTHDT
jgi:hypothetical protein